MKFTFTRILLFLGLTVFVTACSKDKDNSYPAGISCTIDGTNYTFNTNVFGMKSGSTGAYNISVFGSSNASSTPAVIALGIGSEAPIVPGRYGIDFDGPNGEMDLATINFSPPGLTEPYISVPEADNPTEVVITSVSENSIQGTFKGDIFTLGAGGTNPAIRTVTNGKFNVKLQ